MLTSFNNSAWRNFFHQAIPRIGLAVIRSKPKPSLQLWVFRCACGTSYLGGEYHECFEVKFWLRLRFGPRIEAISTKITTNLTYNF